MITHLFTALSQKYSRCFCIGCIFFFDERFEFSRRLAGKRVSEPTAAGGGNREASEGLITPTSATEVYEGSGSGW